MRYVLAIVSFVIAAGLLAYAWIVGSSLYEFRDEWGEGSSELSYGLMVGAASLVIGLLFLVAGIAVLMVRPRSKE